MTWCEDKNNFSFLPVVASAVSSTCSCSFVGTRIVVPQIRAPLPLPSTFHASIVFALSHVLCTAVGSGSWYEVSRRSHERPLFHCFHCGRHPPGRNKPWCDVSLRARGSRTVVPHPVPQHPRVSPPGPRKFVSLHRGDWLCGGWGCESARLKSSTCY